MLINTIRILVYLRNMKRVIIIVAVLALVAFGISSCRSTMDCPAYGEVQKYQSEQRY